MTKEESKTFKDRHGYLRFKDTGRLVHRWMASKKLGRYKHVFKGMQVHHIDGNKLNNHPSNLIILTKEEHEKRHGINKNEKNYD